MTDSRPVDGDRVVRDVSGGPTSLAVPCAIHTTASCHNGLSQGESDTAQPHLCLGLPNHTFVLGCPTTPLSWAAQPHLCLGLPDHTFVLGCPTTPLSWAAQPYFNLVLSNLTLVLGCPTTRSSWAAQLHHRLVLPNYTIVLCCPTIP